MTLPQLLTILGLWTLILGLIFFFSVLPKTVERRARDLNLMEYNGEMNKFVAKDTLQITKWDLYYLQHGNMVGYENE